MLDRQQEIYVRHKTICMHVGPYDGDRNVLSYELQYHFGHRHGDMMLRKQIWSQMGQNLPRIYQSIDYNVALHSDQSADFMYLSTSLKWRGDFEDATNLPEVMDTATAVLADHIAEYLKDKFPKQRIGWYQTMVQDNRALELAIQNENKNTR